MKRALLLVIALSLGSCSFAQRHPAVTIGLVAGTTGFGTCFMAVEKPGTCAAVGGIAGLAIGGITGLVTLLADTNDHTLSSEEPTPEGGMIRRRRPVEEPEGPYLPPEPNPLPPSATVDAGVPDAIPALPTATPDAGAP